MSVDVLRPPGAGAYTLERRLYKNYTRMDDDMDTSDAMEVGWAPGVRASALVTLPPRVTLEDVWLWLSREGYGDINAFVQDARYELPLLPSVHTALTAEYGCRPVPTEHAGQSAVLTAYEAHGSLRLWPFYRGVDYGSLPAETSLTELRALADRYTRLCPVYAPVDTTPPLSNSAPCRTERRSIAQDLLDRELVGIARGGRRYVPANTRPTRRRSPTRTRDDVSPPPRRRFRGGHPPGLWAADR
mgnify:CR=1 FL=1